MKIGIDIRAIGRKRTGDETYTLELVRQLLLNDKKNTYILYTDTRDEKELAEIAKTIGSVEENAQIVPVTPGSKTLWTFLLLPMQAKRDGVDILHVQYITPLAFLGEISLVTTIHDVSFKRYPQFIGKKDLFFLNTLIPRSLKKADGIIAVSEFTKKEIAQFYDVKEEKVRAIQNGCNIESYSKKVGEEEKRKFRKEHDLEKPYLLYVGTHQPRKNIPFLIESFVELKSDNKGDELIDELQFVIGGSRSGKNSDENIDVVFDSIEDEEVKKDIRFEGYIQQEELPLFYRCAKCCVNASLYEGFGLPLLESMASGTPVVCCGDSCFPEVVGDVATFFENNDTKDFCSAVMSVLAKKVDVEIQTQKGRERAKEFSWKSSALQTLDFYATILSEKAQQKDDA